MMEIKDLISLITQINKEVQDLNREIQEGWAEMNMMEIEQKHKEFSNKIARMTLEYNLNVIAVSYTHLTLPTKRIV